MGGIALAKVHISLVTGSPEEARTRDWLLGLFGRYDLSRWQFTDHVQIEEGAIAHSHPVLTLNTRSPDAMSLLSVYLHEQIHWFTLAPAHHEACRCAAQMWRQMYPHVPVEYPEGCGSERSNYLHFTVCYLEHKGMLELVGVEEARRVLEHQIQRPFYRYVYRTISTDFDAMTVVTDSCGLILSAA